MSRIGRLPIPIPKGVTVQIDAGNEVTVRGPKGQLAQTLPVEMSIEMKDGQVIVTRPGDERRLKALHGLTRALLANMVLGVVAGFRRELRIDGVGYRAELRGKNIVLTVGFSHNVVIEPPDSIAFDVDKARNIIGVVGPDKCLVGEMAARIRRVRPPSVYADKAGKSKGIHYVGERLRTKAGKAGKIGKGAK